jgi:hypothetical protein
MLGSRQTLNTWLDKEPRGFHSMERAFAALRAHEIRVMLATCDPTFDAPRDETQNELIHCLS